jgi:hypothetical protein
VHGMGNTPQVGRWKQDTCSAVSSDIFWKSADVSFRSSGPLTHHLRFIQQVPPCGSGRLSQAVTGCEGIWKEFEHIFTDASWASDLIGCIGNADVAAMLLLLQVQVACHSLAAYHRRVVKTLCESSPYFPFTGIVGITIWHILPYLQRTARRNWCRIHVRARSLVSLLCVCPALATWQGTCPANSCSLFALLAPNLCSVIAWCTCLRRDLSLAL